MQALLLFQKPRFQKITERPTVMANIRQKSRCSSHVSGLSSTLAFNILLMVFYGLKRRFSTWSFPSGSTEDIISSEWRYCIFLSVQIQFTVIDAHTVASIIFPNQNNWAAPGALWLLNSTIRQQLVQLLIYDPPLVRWHATRGCLIGACSPVLLSFSIRSTFPKSELFIANTTHLSVGKIAFPDPLKARLKFAE